MRYWQFLLVMIQLLDPKIYTPAFRQARVAKTGQDIILVVMASLWKIIKKDFVPSVRQYIEIFSIKFMLRFPDVALDDPEFHSCLLDPKVHKPQVSASLLVVSGYILCSPLESANAVSYKRKIFEQIVGFTTSNNAHSRCIAQYFVMKVQADSQFGAAFIPSGVMPIIEYLTTSKDVQSVFKKYTGDFKGFEKLCLHQDGVDVILSTRINKEGEYVALPLIETLRAITTESISEYRKKDDNIPIEKKDWWKA